MLRVSFLPLYALLPVALLHAQADHAKNLAPYVPSPQQVVNRMLEAAQLKPGETVYDLGCGDGRVLITAARQFRAKAVGVELSPKIASVAREAIRQAGVQDMATVIQGNLLEVDLSKADVVTVYLLTDSNAKLKPNLEKYLKPGARVVSHDFEIRGWKPVRSEEVNAYRRAHRIYVYEIGKQ